jgi:hypothetical protein
MVIYFFSFFLNEYKCLYRFEIEFVFPVKGSEDYYFSISSGKRWYWENCIWSFTDNGTTRDGSFFRLCYEGGWCEGKRDGSGEEKKGRNGMEDGDREKERKKKKN